MSLNSETKLYGILGNPVRHSLSPELHNALFKKHGLNAVYVALEPGLESLALAFEGLRALGIAGVNITIPFKEQASDLCDEVPEDIDRAMGAVNTVVNRSGRLFGYNTDRAGFIGSLRDDLSFDPAGKTALVIGAGGAARGVVFALADAGADAVLIVNRNTERAKGLEAFSSARFVDTDIRALAGPAEAAREKIDLVVNATSLGMNAEDPQPFSLRTLKHEASVIDLVYRPARTRLLAEAEALGLKHTNGLGMLAGQAALSFGLWTGLTEGVRNAMLEIVRKWK